jgi:hypothetical protein
MAYNNEGDPWIAKREDTVAGHQYIWFNEVRPATCTAGFAENAGDTDNTCQMSISAQRCASTDEGRPAMLPCHFLSL